MADRAMSLKMVLELSLANARRADVRTTRTPATI
jgi:hypothetical protein